ncbi:MAG TPA: ribokinase [Terracidiphilus sp.]
MKSIVVVGSVNLDLVCTGKRIPAPGETVTGDQFQTFHGGKGANQAVAVGRLGYPVSMVAKVGDDEFGARLRKGLQDAGVEVSDVGVARGTASGVALISVDAHGQNSITVVPGANGKLLPRDLDKALASLRSAGMILAQLEVPMETVEHLAEIAERYSVPLMLDPAPARPIPRSVLRRVTYLTPNETEACVLCGTARGALTPKNAGKYAEKLLKRGPANVVIKMGGRGAFVASGDGLRTMAPSFKVPVVDSTAAGDAFNGGLAVALMRGADLGEAVRFAAAVGAVSVTRQGAQPAMPTAREVNRVLKGHGI